MRAAVEDPDVLGPDPSDMYDPTRRAIEDGLWSVIRTAAYGVGLCLLALVGLQVVVLTLLFGGRDPVSAGLLLAGLGAGAGGGYEFAATFDLRRAIRDQRRGRRSDTGGDERRDRRSE